MLHKTICFLQSGSSLPGAYSQANKVYFGLKISQHTCYRTVKLGDNVSVTTNCFPCSPVHDIISIPSQDCTRPYDTAFGMNTNFFLEFSVKGPKANVPGLLFDAESYAWTNIILHDQSTSAADLKLGSTDFFSSDLLNRKRYLSLDRNVMQRKTHMLLFKLDSKTKSTEKVRNMLFIWLFCCSGSMCLLRPGKLKDQEMWLSLSCL